MSSCFPLLPQVNCLVLCTCLTYRGHSSRHSPEGSQEALITSVLLLLLAATATVWRESKTLSSPRFLDEVLAPSDTLRAPKPRRYSNSAEVCVRIPNGGSPWSIPPQRLWLFYSQLQHEIMPVAMSGGVGRWVSRWGHQEVISLHLGHQRSQQKTAAIVYIAEHTVGFMGCKTTYCQQTPYFLVKGQEASSLSK